MTADQKRINTELKVERLKWDSNKGCIKCNLRDNMSWELEQERDIVNHMTHKHTVLSKLKKIKCPYCPKTLSEKRTMLIHLRIAEQRRGNAYDVMLCPKYIRKEPSKIWDDLLRKNNCIPESRLE